jgi:hypothetical protein
LIGAVIIAGDGPEVFAMKLLIFLCVIVVLLAVPAVRADGRNASAEAAG